MSKVQLRREESTFLDCYTITMQSWKSVKIRPKSPWKSVEIDLKIPWKNVKQGDKLAIFQFIW